MLHSYANPNPNILTPKLFNNYRRLEATLQTVQFQISRLICDFSVLQSLELFRLQI